MLVPVPLAPAALASTIAEAVAATRATVTAGASIAASCAQWRPQ